MENSGYHIIDEACTQADKPPWNPTSLFFMTLLLNPIGAPLFALNWPRLGRPEKLIPAACCAAAVVLAPWLLILGSLLLKQPVSSPAIRWIMQLASMVFAYVMMQAQLAPFNLHMARGGRKAISWPQWLICLLALAAIFACVR
jgi:hypothetical protein